jgi:endonuclease/exonuclease/phosphatase family metal-dependent hydrolase
MIKTKSKLNFFDRLVLLFNYFAALCLLISYLAPSTDPKSFWPIAFFGLAYPFILLVNVILIGYWLVRFKIQILLSIICIALGWKVLQYNVGFHKKTDDTPKADTSAIRMMEYNAHSFNSPLNYNISTRHDILELIKHEQPDVLNIEEFHTLSKGRLAMCDSVKKAMSVKYFYYQMFEGNVHDGGGLAIFSKYPIINRGVIRLVDDVTDTNKSIYIDININGKTVRIYCVHFQSFMLSVEDHALVDNMKQSGKPSVHASRQIGGKLKAGFLHRSDQVKMLKAELAKCPYPYILAGDFNDTPSSYAVNYMADSLKVAFREQGRGLGRTYNGDVPNYQIDYIMCSPAFNVLNYRVIEKRLSDHYPVRSDLVLK